MWANFKSMPRFLKFLTAQAGSCFVFFVCSVVPNHSFSVDGHIVTYSQWWSSGAGPLASSLGVIGPFVAWLLLQKSQHARAWYLGFLALGFVAPYPFLGPLAYGLLGVLVAGAGAFYLYRWQSVQVYFTCSHSP